MKENHCCDLGAERKMRRTLPLGNFQKKKKSPARLKQKKTEKRKEKKDRKKKESLS